MKKLLAYQGKIKILHQYLGKESKEKSVEKPEKGVATFGDTDLDEGLMNQEAVEILNKLKLTLPSKLKNSKLEDIKSYQSSAEEHFNKYTNLLPPTRAILYKEDGVHKAVERSVNPNLETKKPVKYYNTLGQYISNIDSLVKYAKKKQDRVLSTSITLFNSSKDLNYSLVPSLLETMV